MIPRYSRPEMTALWTDESRFQLWLDIEIAALEQFVKEGLAPASALETVRKKAAFSVTRVLEIEKEVKHDVIAFLTNVAEHVGPEARFLHLGMTSSDVVDTAFSIQLHRATKLILKGIDDLLSVTKNLALKHKKTICIGRSHGIHAEPTTFGLKVAGWYAELKRQRERVSSAGEGIRVGAISGPVGTFAQVTPAVEAHVCKVLGLNIDPVSTQVISRDRHAALFLSYAQLGATLERICVEIRHLQRTEVREAEEFFSPGQKGSSAMPHKRNPVLTENITGLARLLRAWAQASLENISLWHERDISHSSVERVIGPDSTITLDFMLARVKNVVENLVVYPENMKRNLELTHGLPYSGSLLVALTKKGISREDAYKMVQQHALLAWESINDDSLKPGMSFPERILADTKITSLLSGEELRQVLSIESHLTAVDEIFKRVFDA